MFTASMIEYHVDEEKKVVTATVTGVEYDAIDMMKKAFRQQNIILNDTDVCINMEPDEDGKYTDENMTINDVRISTCYKYRLPNTFTAKATYDPNDPNPYSVERGKQIARRRLYNQYNLAYHNALNNIHDALKAVTQKLFDETALAYKREVNFEYFEDYNVKKLHCQCSQKL